MDYDDKPDKYTVVTCKVVKNLVFKKQEDLDKIKKLIGEKGYPIKFGSTTVTEKIETLKLKGDKNEVIVIRHDKKDKKNHNAPKEIKKVSKQEKTQKKRQADILDGNYVAIENITLSGNEVGFDFSELQ